MSGGGVTSRLVSSSNNPLLQVSPSLHVGPQLGQRPENSLQIAFEVGKHSPDSSALLILSLLYFNLLIQSVAFWEVIMDG